MTILATILGHVWATLLAVALGACLLALLPRPDARRAWPEWLGLAYLLGVMALAVELYLVGLVGRIGPVGLLALNAPLAAAGVWRAVRSTSPRTAQPGTWNLKPETLGEAWAWWHGALLALILVHAAWVLAMNLSELRRTDDAFSCALSLARHVWDARTHADFTMPYNYPKSPGLVISFFMFARGAWNEWGVNLVYFNWWAALILLTYGNLRVILARGPCLAAVYLISAMPLALNHAVMVGYSDLPMAVFLTFAGIYIYRWARAGDEVRGGRELLALAIAFSLCLPLIKAEGRIPYLPFALWALLVAAAGRRGVPPARLWAALGIVILMGAAAIAAIAWKYGPAGPAWLPPDLWNRIRPENHLAEAWTPLVAHFGSYYGNWLIVGTLAPFAFMILSAIRWRRSDLALAQFGLLLIAAYVYLFVFGGAFEWLRVGTTVNRLYMQLLPILIYGCAVMLPGRRSACAKTSA